MSDILKIPLYYIAFKPNEKVVKHYQSYGFENINHFPAVIGKKLNVNNLIKDDIISIRAYDDLKSGRTEHSGMPSMGAIGCSLSHYGIWNICVNNNLPFIIVAEDDNRIYRLTDQDKKNISEIISKPNGVFISVKLEKQDHRKHFFGSHFYILSKGGCEQLVKHFFPIDVQVDWYMGSQATIGNIDLQGYPISKQVRDKSSIQTPLKCIKCFLPKKTSFYIWVIIAILIIIILAIVFVIKWASCEKSCSISCSKSYKEY